MKKNPNEQKKLWEKIKSFFTKHVKCRKGKSVSEQTDEAKLEGTPETPHPPSDGVLDDDISKKSTDVNKGELSEIKNMIAELTKQMSELFGKITEISESIEKITTESSTTSMKTKTILQTLYELKANDTAGDNNSVQNAHESALVYKRDICHAYTEAKKGEWQDRKNFRKEWKAIYVGLTDKESSRVRSDYSLSEYKVSDDVATPKMFYAAQDGAGFVFMDFEVTKGLGIGQWKEFGVETFFDIIPDNERAGDSEPAKVMRNEDKITRVNNKGKIYYKKIKEGDN